jgi:hypothetical protein
MTAGRRPTSKPALVVEILAAYLQVRLRLRRATLPAKLRALRGDERPDEPGRPDEPVRLGRAVGRTLAVLPPQGRCLMQSLVLTKLLSRRGLESELVIGVTQDEAFAAHAWVEHEHVPLLPPLEHRFERLARL